MTDYYEIDEYRKPMSRNRRVAFEPQAANKQRFTIEKYVLHQERHCLHRQIQANAYRVTLNKRDFMYPHCPCIWDLKLLVGNVKLFLS